MKRIQPRLKPTCARCGEELTAPIEYNGGLYGWTCIKIVCPSAKRTNKKELWLSVDSHNDTVLENGNTKRVAIVYGKKYVDFVQKNSPYPFKHIIKNGDGCFINAASYPKLLQINFDLTNPKTIK